MEIFEIHITGDKEIINLANKLSLKTIVIDLLKPDKSHLRTEYMTSHAQKFNNCKDCKAFVDNAAKELGNVVRIKIESPYYEHYVNQSVYIESHFKAVNSSYPMSKNQNKDSLLATDREYKIENYEFFRRKYKGVVVELCLYDSNINEDLDWFNLYKGIQ